MTQATDTSLEIKLTAHDLPLHCPRPDSPLWARHPRVFLDVLKTGEATCPYCSTRYRFSGEAPKGHH
ncbi:MAG: zinc-finger domain-containing protein [Sterolibacterium sp.]